MPLVVSKALTEPGNTFYTRKVLLLQWFSIDIKIVCYRNRHVTYMRDITDVNVGTRRWYSDHPGGEWRTMVDVGARLRLVQVSLPCDSTCQGWSIVNIYDILPWNVIWSYWFLYTHLIAIPAEKYHIISFQALEREST